MKRKIFLYCNILLFILLNSAIVRAQISKQTIPNATGFEKKTSVNQAASAACTANPAQTVLINQELEDFLNSAYYQALPSDSVFHPEMIELGPNDQRTQHLYVNGVPVNPLIPGHYPGKYKDGGANYQASAYIPDHIDFVQIEGKVYYRLFISIGNLTNFFPNEIIDYSTYPGFLLLEIKEDINAIAFSYIQNGADSVKILNDNCIKVFKKKNNLNIMNPEEAYNYSKSNYPGYFKFVRAENALYLPLKTNYPDPSKEVKGKRTTNSRHFTTNSGSIDAVFSIRPTSYPLLPPGGHIDLNNLNEVQKSKIKWIELPACYPVPSMKPATKATYTDYFDETFYGHSVYCTNDQTYPYVWICAVGDGNYLGTIGALEDDDFWSGDEHNYNRIHDKFDITSIQDGSNITGAQYETYLPNISPYVTGDCDGLISWEEVDPEIKNMTNNMTAANNPHTDGVVDYYSNLWYNDVEDGTVYYVAAGWPWDKNDGYTGYDCDFNAAGLADIQYRLVGNWYVVGVADKDENNQNPNYWEAVATWNYYSNFRISYTPCCIAPTSVTAYANGGSSASVCPNASFPLTMFSNSGGGCYCGTWQYAWYNGTKWWNGSAFSSSTPVYDAAYSTINTSITANTTFTLRMNCSSCNAYTEDDVVVSVYTASAAATSITGTNSICPGASTTLTLNGGSLGTGASWRWYSGSCGGTFVGTGTSISVSPTSNTTYYVRAEGTCNTTACVSFSVTLLAASSPATSATASPASINSGGSSTLTLNGGSLGLGATWIWYSGSCGGTQVGTGTSISVSPTENTTYYVRAVGTCNTTQCVSVTVSVTTSFTICYGQNITLTPQGGISEPGAVFQWYAGGCGTGSVLATTATYTVTPLATTTYYVRRNGACYTTGCASVQVTVNSLSVAPTSISGNNTICEGGSTILTINGGFLGTGANWNWYSGSCGGTYVGQGNPITVSPSTNTTYYARAEGACPATTCVSYAVNVSLDPTISISANNTTICEGGSVVFTQTTSGGAGTITNQWQYSSDGVNWTNWTTSTNPTYLNLTSSMFFRCVRTATASGCGDAISNTLFITVVPDPIIGTQPLSPPEICIGGTTASITTVGSNGTGTFSYQWQYLNGATWGNVANGVPSGSTYTGGTAASMSVAGITVYGTYQYHCIISQTGSGCGQLTTDVVNVIVNPDMSIAVTGTSTICSGGTASLMSTLTGGSGTITYQWQSSPDHVNWTTISGANSAGFQTPVLTTTTYYRVFVYSDGSGCGDANSSYFTVTVNPDPSVSTQPLSGAICPGGTWPMSVTAAGGIGAYSYQWQSYNGSTWNDISGATSSSYSASPANTTLYQCLVATLGDGCNYATSNTVTVTVNPAPTMSSASSKTICSGLTVGLSLTSVVPSTYSWVATANGNVTGESTTAQSSATISDVLTNTTTSVQTVIYTVTPTSSTGTCAGTSQTVTVTVNPAPAVSNSPLTQTICSGGATTAVTLTANVAGTTFAWTATATAGVSGFTASGTSTIPVQTISTTGTTQGTVTYAITPTANSCAGSVTNYTVLVNPKPTVSPLSTPSTICIGTSASLSASSLVSGAAFSWNPGSLNGSPVSVTPMSTTTYTVTSSASGCTANAAVTVTISTPSTTVLVVGDYIWSGNTGTDWGAPANWLIFGGSTFSVAGTIPDNTKNVIIRDYSPCGSNIAHVPTLTSGNCKNLTIETHLVMDATATLNVFGNWTNNGTFDAGSSTVAFLGANTPVLINTGGVGLTHDFYNLIINKTNTTDLVRVETNDVAVTNTLTMLKGNIDALSNNKLLELGTSTSNLGTLSYTDGFVYGTMKRWFATAINGGNSTGLFPFGLGTNNRHMLVEYTNAPTGGSLTAFFNATPMAWSPSWLSQLELVPAASPCPSFYIASLDDKGYWDVTPGNSLSGGNYNITLTGGGITYTNLCQLTAVKRVQSLGPDWVQVGTHISPWMVGVNPKVQRIGASGWSNWGLGGGRDNPLPISLLDFNAVCENNVVDITWVTATETNNDYFTIQRSADAANWEFVKNIPGNGNSNKILYYSTTDTDPLAETSYYRLKQTDFDGASETFSPVAVICRDNNDGQGISYYPNPFTSEVVAELQNVSFEKAVLRIYDLLGKIVYEKELKSSEMPEQKITIDLYSLPAGVYSAEFVSDHFSNVSKIVKNY